MEAMIRPMPFLALLVLLWTAAPVHSQVSMGFPDTSGARKQTFADLVRSPELQKSQGARFLSQGELKPRVKYEVFYQRDKASPEGRPVYYFSFVPEQDYKFQYGRKGHAVVKMDAATGKLESLKIFTQDVELTTAEDLGQRTRGSFLLVTPREPRTVLSVYLEGQRIFSEIPLPWSMGAVLDVPVTRWKEAARDYLDWEYVFPVHTRSAKEVESAVMEARRLLVNIPEVDDGAQDARGRWVTIQQELPQSGPGGFNCSGFAKWITDGLVRPLIGQGLEIAPLKERPSELRGHSYNRPYDDPDQPERLRDPYFGLDWTRNLAVSLARLQNPDREWGAESRDVRENIFFSYAKTRGFRIDDLDPILYGLAVKKPGRIYLGSVNGDFRPPGAGPKDPVLNQHRHIAVFFPWIDPWGTYRLAVFEVNSETSLPRLQRAYPNHWVHLVELQITGDFQPFNLLQGRPSPRFPDNGRLLR